MKFQSKLLSLLIAIVISGCGGSSNSPDSSDSPDLVKDPSISHSGIVADGYLRGATVCLDLNQNKNCDTDEPVAITEEGGKFTLDEVTQEQIEQFPLLVEIVEGQTIDEDNPGVVLKDSYTLSAPAGFTFVSPLTTMVQNEVENGRSPAQAEEFVKTKVGTKLSLNEDYVAGKKDEVSETQSEFEKLHQVAQVTARVMANNMSKLENIAANEGIPADKLIRLIVDEVLEALDEISVEVKKAKADSSITFNPDSIATDIDNEVVAIEPETLEEQIAQKDAEKSAVVANLSELIKTDGISWFWGETDNYGMELEYGTLKLSGSTVVSNYNEFDFYTGEFESETILSTDDINLYIDDEAWMLSKSQGWVNYDEEIVTSVTTNDNSIILHYANGEQFDETVTGTKVDLSGLNIATALKNTDGDDTWSTFIKSDATFPEGAFGYNIVFSQQTIYMFESHDWWCNDSNGSFSQAIKDQLNGICNYILAPTAELDTYGKYINTLSELKQSEILIGWHDYNEIRAKFNSDGTVGFYEVNEQGTNELASGTWSEISAYEATLIKVVAPFAVYSLTNDNDTIYFAEHAGFVRKVWQESPDQDQVLVFDATARDAILANFRPTPPLKIVTAEIEVDGSNTDWVGIEPALVDAEGDAGISSMDLTAIYLAQDDTNLYLRLDKASLNELPIEGAYYNYWVYFESNDVGPEFALSLFHSDIYGVSPQLWNIKGRGRNPEPESDLIADITNYHTASQYIEVAVPKSLIDTTVKYTLDFFTHYSNTADTWDDRVEEHDTGELLISGVVFN